VMRTGWRIGSRTAVIFGSQAAKKSDKNMI
jgi:hypothetical protein